METEKMSELKYEVNRSIDREYLRASDKFGRVNHSDHESYAVILEEWEEAEAERYRFIEALERFWTNVKIGGIDQSNIEILAEMHRRMMRMSCECIQTGAMCFKAMATIQERQKPINGAGIVSISEKTAKRIAGDFMKSAEGKNG